MKAIVQDRYGDANVLRFGELPRPTPIAGEVLVRVHAASMHPDVWHVLTGLPYVLRVMGAGVSKPKNPVPGTDVSGIVEAVGPGVTRFCVGDEVFGETIRGMQWVNGGAFAEYAVAPETALALKPPNVSFEVAAAVPTAGLIALHNVEAAGELAPGSRALVNGAAGGVGSLALQILKARGVRVTAVDRADKLALLSTLGADQVIDYQTEDFTLRPERYALILDIPTNRPFSEHRRALEPNGVYVPIGHDHFGSGMQRVFGLIPRMVGLMARGLFTRQLARPNLAPPDRPKLMATLAGLLERGALTPHVDHVFSLAEVPEALRALKSGNTRGKLVIRVAGP